MNKVVLITGASRGIGEATATIFAKNNYDIIINYQKEKEKAENLSHELEKKYKIKTLCIKCDISSEEEVKNMFDLINKTFNKLDVVVNNAGIAIDSILEDKTKETFRKTLDINLIGPFLVCKYAKKYITKGAVVNVSSTNSINSYYPFSIDYDASKAGLNLLTKDLAVEFAPNIRVNAVAPGWVNTDMNKTLDQEFIDEELKKITLKRFAEPLEIAKVIYFLASEDASYINGEIIVVDGGRN